MPMSENGRREAVKAALEAYGESPQQERINLPYKDGTEGPFSVISIPLDAVVFNPRSHRIKSQLESHAKRQVVAEEPYGEEAQAVIHEILTATEGFADLKNNLDEYGQRDPGVVTRAGLLVNANTRLAALREIDPNGYIRAALLPSDADDKAIDRLELELQVQRDLKQDYTFTNELLFINELIDVHGYSVEDAAKALNWAASADESELRKGKARINQSVRIFASVRSIQSMSGNKIPLTFFDDKKQILIDLDDTYESMKISDGPGAERMKEARILGLLADCNYRDLRQFDGTSTVLTLIPELEKAEALKDDIETLTKPATDDNGDDGGGEDDSGLLTEGSTTETDLAEESSLQPLVDVLAMSHDSDEVELPDSGTAVDRVALLDEISRAVETASEDVRRDKREAKTTEGPVKALEVALDKANKALSGYADAHAAGDFDESKFGYLKKKLRTTLDAIDKAVEQSEEK